MSLASNALITLEYFKTISKVAKDATTYPDEAIEALINQASQVLESECNCKLITPANAIDEIFDGNRDREHFVKNGRITTTPTLKEWDGDSFETTTYTFTYDGDSGKVYFTDGNVFNRGRNNWQVGYKYGWAIASVPVDLKLACVGIVNSLSLMYAKAGIASESIGNNSFSYDWSGHNPLIKNVIGKYQVLSYG